jgi:hypothetical protein
MAVTDPRDHLDRSDDNAQTAEAAASPGKQELGVEDAGGGR